MTASFAKPGSFRRRVTAVFSTKVVAFGLSLATTLVISRILGPAGKGEYVAVLALPGLLGGIGVFGLPSAVNYFGSRGVSARGLLGAGLLFTTVLCVVLIPLLWVGLPWLETGIFRAAPDTQLRLILIVIPAAFMTSFATAVLVARQKVRTYNTILIGQGVITLLISVLLVAVFHFGVPGAVATSIIVTWVALIADIIAVAHLAKREPGGEPVSLRRLGAYGVKIYPASVTGYFNYRVDSYLIQALMLAPKGPLGLYSMATTMAELIFYVPDSVTTILFPRLAAVSSEEADELVGRVSRMTVLLTCLVAAAMIPGAYFGVHLVLPAFDDCLPAFCILLPAVIALSVSKVMASYIAGRGKPGRIAFTSTATVVINICANIVLIPQFGIIGAALASLISYSASAGAVLVVASNMSGRSVQSLVVPGIEDVRILDTAVHRALAAAIARGRASRPGRKRGAGAAEP
jgi:O-antigen/teichoic acid export membrane protein